MKARFLPCSACPMRFWILLRGDPIARFCGSVRPWLADQSRQVVDIILRGLGLNAQDAQTLAAKPFPHLDIQSMVRLCPHIAAQGLRANCALYLIVCTGRFVAIPCERYGQPTPLGIWSHQRVMPGTISPAQGKALQRSKPSIMFLPDRRTMERFARPQVSIRTCAGQRRAHNPPCLPCARGPLQTA